MSEPIRVTLIMPSYRRGAKIAAALDSVLAQTRVPDEIVVVNDGSYPATTDWVTRHYPTVRLLDIAHGGTCVARNRGAAAATSQVLIFFDDDDTMLPHAVATLLDLLVTFPEARAAFTDHTFTNTVTGEHHPNHHSFLTHFKRLRNVEPLRREGTDRLYDRRLFQAMLWGNLLQQPWAIDRDTFLALGGYCPTQTTHEDWEFYLRIAQSYPVAVSDTICSHHYVEKAREHMTQMTGQIEAQMQVLQRVRKASTWSDWQTRAVVRQRLGMLHKTAGDNLRKADRRAAWQAYLRSFAAWPFDRTVAARALVLWPLQLLLRRKPAPAGRAEP